MLLFTVLGGVLAGCQTSGPVDESAFASEIPKGSSLILKQDLDVTPGAARVSMQKGKVVGQPSSQVASCQLRSGQTATEDTPVVISADTFITGAASRYYANGSRNFNESVVFQTKIPLHSPQQPNVKFMYCDITGETTWTRHLTVAQIRETLGDIFELQLLSAN